jgi:hypothetical protein
MSGDWSFVVWIVVIAIPIGIAFTTLWARSRGPGSAMLDKPSADDPRDPI